MERQDFENQLADLLLSQWQQFAASLPVGYEIEDALRDADRFDEEARATFIARTTDLLTNAAFGSASGPELGMNSPGILWDRLTILHCKAIFTGPQSPHRRTNDHSHLGDVTAEISDVLKVLHEAQPAKNVLLAKESTQRQSASPSLGQALWDLQVSNVAMWINQDLLYTVDVNMVSEKRLRDYIKFFSVANRRRNTAIEHVELTYKENMQSH
jgi:hypothetical protein